MVATDTAGSIGVERVAAQLQEVAVPGQGRAVPDETVHPVAEVREILLDVGIGAEPAFVAVAHPARRPVHEEPAVVGEVGVEGDAEEAALVEEVDGEVDGGLGELAVDDVLDQPGALLRYEEVVGPQERQGRRLGQSVDGHFDAECRVLHRRPGGRRAAGLTRRARLAARTRSGRRGDRARRCLVAGGACAKDQDQPREGRGHLGTHCVTPLG